MSENIRKYKHDKEWFNEAEDLILTAFFGGEKYGHGIQFTIGGHFITLSEQQLLDLISVISRRLNCRTGFTATGITDLKIILSNGAITVDEEKDV